MKEIRVATLSGAGLDFTLSNVEDETDDYQGYLTDLTGWYGGVGVSGDDPQRTLGHGLFGQPSVRTGRELTLEGTLVFKDEQTRKIADRFVSGLLWDGEEGRLTVTTDELTQYATVKLAGEIGHSYLGQYGLQVQIPLRAADPFIYSEPQTSQVYIAGTGEGLVFPLFGVPDGGSEPALDYGAGAPLSGYVHNAGNATAFPVITVQGSFPAGFSLTYQGQELLYPAPVVPQAPVEIHTRTGEVLVSGIDQTYRLRKRSWFEVAPGESFQPHLTPLAPSSGWADVTLHDTYI